MGLAYPTDDDSPTGDDHASATTNVSSDGVEFEKQNDKHIILMVHLSRSASIDFTFDFDSRWRYVLLDDIKPVIEAQIPSTTKLLSNTEMELIRNMEMKPTLTQLFRSCLARLIYPQNRTSADIQAQIEMMLQLFDDSDFMQIIVQRLYQLISISVSNASTKGVSWQLSVANAAGEVALAGNFRKALFHRLAASISSVFTQLICYLERNYLSRLYWRCARSSSSSGLTNSNSLVASLEPTRQLWMAMFKNSAICNINVVAGGNTSAHYDVLNDGRSRLLQSAFPFSFVFIHALEAMRSEAEKLPGRLADALQRLTETSFPMLRGGDGDEIYRLSRAQLEDYIHDYVYVVCGQTKVSEHAMLVIYKSILLKAQEQPLSSIAQVHAAHWLNERRFYYTFYLLDLLDGVSARFLESGVPRLAESGFSLYDLDSVLVDLVLSELTPSSLQTLETPEQRQQWIQRVSDAQPAIESLMRPQLETPSLASEGTERRWHMWQSLRLLRLFVRDVAFPLSLATDDCSSLFGTLTSVPHFNGHRTFIELLNQMQRLSESGATLIEPDAAMPASVLGVSLSTTGSSTTTASGRKYRKSRTAAAAAAANDGSYHPNVTAVVKCSQFLSHYISEVCFRNAAAGAQLEPKLLEDLLAILAGKHTSFVSALSSTALPAGDARKPSMLLASSALRTHLARQLVQLPRDSSAYQLGKQHFAKLLENDDVESEPCMLYVQAIEDVYWRSAEQAATAGSSESELALEALQHHDDNGSGGVTLARLAQPTTPLLERLESIGRARFGIAVLMRQVAQAFDERSRTLASKALDETLLHATNALLQSDDVAAAEGVRVYALKMFARQRGVACCQALLQSPSALAAMPWLQQYCATPKAEHFLRKRHLLQSDPFLLQEGYDAARLAVQRAVDGNLAAFKQYVALASRDAAAKQHAKGIVFLALWQEVYMLYTVDGFSPASAPKVAALLTWVEKTLCGDLYTRQELAIVLPFCKNRFHASVLTGDISIRELFTLSSASSSSQLLLGTVLAHLVAVLLSSRSPAPLFLARLLLQPASGVTTFLPTMPDDERQALMAVLGGGWYECPNGHTYYVDACGRPMEQRQCATCGELIGGVDHVLESTNRQAETTQDRTAPGYVVGSAATAANAAIKAISDEEAAAAAAAAATTPAAAAGTDSGLATDVVAADTQATAPKPATSEDDNQLQRYLSERDLPPTSYRVMRLLLHAVLSVSCATDGVLQAEVQTLLRPPPPAGETRDMSTNDVADVPLFIYKQLTADWRVLRQQTSISEEQLSMLLHVVIASFSRDADRGQAHTQLAMANKTERHEWETQFHAHYLHETMRDVRSALQRHLAALPGQDESLVSELRETLTISHVAAPVRLQQTPTLWRFRAAVALSHLRDQFDLDSHNKEHFPVLHLFLTQEDQLRALRHLRGAVEWQKLLSLRFDRRVDRDWSRTTTAEAVLAELPGDELRRWEAAFHGFREAWNTAWRFVDRYVCMEIPSIFRAIVMEPSTPLCFSMPDERDEGICPLSLVRYLVDRHNQFLEHVLTILNRKASSSAAKLSMAEQPHVPTHLLTDEHLINYDARELVPFLQSQAEQSFAYGSGESLRYNLEQIEQHLVDTILSGKPFIELEVRKFSFTNETRITGALISLRGKIPQAELPTDVKKQILDELQRIGGVRRAMEVLEVCISFLSATGGAHVKTLPGNLSLHSYVRDTLVMPDCVEITSGAVSKYVQLQHIVALWTFLEEALAVDPFQGVVPCYKADLPDSAKEDIEAVVRKLDLAFLLPLFKEFILANLKDENMGEEVVLKGALGCVEDENGNELESLSWFAHFPTSMKLKHTVATYLFLASLV